MIANEAHLPYQRPPLSKKYLAGEILFDRMLIKAEPFYARHDVRLFLDTSAVSVDRERQVVTLSNGEDIEYSGLVLATGASIRRLAIAGADLAGIHYVRTVADVDRLRASFGPVHAWLLSAAAISGSKWRQ